MEYAVQTKIVGGSEWGETFPFETEAQCWKWMKWHNGDGASDDRMACRYDYRILRYIDPDDKNSAMVLACSILHVDGWPFTV
jgi:hypothetical protein